MFLGERAWFAVRIAGAMLNKIKFIAAYQTQPVSAVTHWAPVERIEPYGDGGKYKLFFSEPAREITPIPYGDAPQGTVPCGGSRCSHEPASAPRPARYVFC